MNVRQLALGEYTSCALDTSNQIRCWGHNWGQTEASLDYSKFGSGSKNPSHTYTPTRTASPFGPVVPWGPDVAQLERLPRIRP